METPRFLSDSEIDEIVSVIPPVQAATKDIEIYNLAAIVETTRRQLTEIKLKPSKIEELKAIIYNRCRRSLIQAGETVGLHASEAISEPITQANLNTFHQAGGADVGGSGTRMFAEILNVTHNRKTPTANIHLNNMDMTFDEAIGAAKAFMTVPVETLLEPNSIEGVTFITIEEQGDLETRGSFYQSFSKFAQALYENTGQLQAKKYLDHGVNAKAGSTFIRLHLNVFRLFSSRITTRDVASAIDEIGGTVSIFSPTSVGIVDVYVDNLHTPPKGSPAKLSEKFKNVIGNEGDSDSLSYLSNATCLYLQMFILPNIRNKAITSTSSIIQNTFAAGQFVPSQALPIALFHYAKVQNIETLSIVRGATHSSRTDVNEWVIWINKHNLHTGGVPIQKLYNLIYEVYGKESIIFPAPEQLASLRISDAPDMIKLVLPLNENPVENIRKIIEQEKTSYNLSVSAIRKGGGDHLISNIPDESSILKAGRYRFIIGYFSIAKALRRLIVHPSIRANSTITNSPHEILEVRGIEVARSFLFRELYDMIKKTDALVNLRHIQIIVDVMTSTGTLMPFTARGSVRQQLGAFAESSFEQALQAFQRAAVSGLPEPVNATSTSILVGKRCLFGTGSFKIGRAPGAPILQTPGRVEPLGDSSKAVPNSNSDYSAVDPGASAIDTGAACGGGDDGGLGSGEIDALLNTAAAGDSAQTSSLYERMIGATTGLPRLPNSSRILGPQPFPPISIPDGVFAAGESILASS
jgi:hypothetical protein